MSAEEFYVVSLKWTKRDSKYITFWRPDDCGYAWPLSWAGKYSAEKISANLAYYHRGDDTLAVPCHVLDDMAVSPEKGYIDGDAGPVVLNNKANWLTILGQARPNAMYVPKPEYRGAPRRSKKEVA